MGRSRREGGRRGTRRREPSLREGLADGRLDEPRPRGVLRPLPRRDPRAARHARSVGALAARQDRKAGDGGRRRSVESLRVRQGPVLRHLRSRDRAGVPRQPAYGPLAAGRRRRSGDLAPAADVRVGALRALALSYVRRADARGARLADRARPVGRDHVSRAPRRARRARARGLFARRGARGRSGPADRALVAPRERQDLRHRRDHARGAVRPLALDRRSFERGGPRADERFVDPVRSQRESGRRDRRADPAGMGRARHRFLSRRAGVAVRRQAPPMGEDRRGEPHQSRCAGHAER